MDIKFGKIITLFVFVVFLSACGGGGGSGGTETTDTPTNEPITPVVLQGRFLDSAVEGVRYTTTTQDSFTDADGTFRYIADEEVSFFVGGIFLGSTQASAVLTPLDLANTNDETNPQVINIIRFLQTLDEDDDPSNGIRIIEDVSDLATDLATDLSVEFDMSVLEFETDSDVITVVFFLTATIDNPRDLVAVDVALAHFRLTLGRDEPSDPDPTPDPAPTPDPNPFPNDPFGGVNITGPVGLVRPSFVPDFASSNLQIVPGVGGLGIGLWTQTGGVLTVSMFGGEGFGISFLSSQLGGDVASVTYGISCESPTFPAECNKISLDVNARTIVFRNVALKLGTVVSGVIVDRSPIFFTGTLIWQ